jgi:hypothetical protein
MQKVSTPPALNYNRINTSALTVASVLIPRWLPDGRRDGREWVARNPNRNDQNLGSFKTNMETGRWADFATGDRGRDLISLLAFVRGVTQGQAARMLAREIASLP